MGMRLKSVRSTRRTIKVLRNKRTHRKEARMIRRRMVGERWAAENVKGYKPLSQAQVRQRMLAARSSRRRRR